MAKETTYSGILGDWQRLGGSLASNTADLTHVQGVVQRFGELSTRAQEIVKQQAAQVATKQATSKELRTVVVEGQRLASLLRQAVKQQYGIRSEKLAEFGLQPFRGRPRREPPVVQEPEPAPAPTASTATKG
jgi:hypothetical protein